MTQLNQLPLLRTDINLAVFCQAGVYKIICLQNNKIYVGESNNCLDRIGKHFTTLKNQTHHCLSLQKDFNTYGFLNFEAFVVYSGSKLIKTSTRKKIEKKLIQSLPKQSRYNFDVRNSQKPFYGSYCYKNKTFNTIKELRLYIKQTEKKIYSESHFRRLFISPFGKYKDQIKLIEKRSQSDIFLINGQKYNGWKTVVKAGLAKNQRQVFFRLKSSKWPNYVYYLKTKKRQGFTTTTYQVDNKLYHGAEEVVKARLAEDIHQVYYRVRSSSNLWIRWKKIN